MDCVPKKTKKWEAQKNKVESQMAFAGFELPSLFPVLTANASTFPTSSKIQPATELCMVCRLVVQRAKPQTLKFVEVSNQTNHNPRKGATDKTGKILGFIHNEKALRKNPPTMNVTSEEIKKQCLMRDDNFEMIMGKIRVASEKELIQQRKELENKQVPVQPLKILCIVHSNAAEHTHKVQRIRETWGPHCDGFIVASDKTDPAYDAVNILHEGPGTGNNLWQKIRSIWSYVYEHYYASYDWFHIGSDEMFLIVENLRLYLESEEIRTAANGAYYLPMGNETFQVPLYLGCRHKRGGKANDIFNAGGGGYTLNKAALKTLVLDGLPKYFQGNVTGAADVMVAWVFRHLAVFPYETKDSTGGERYNVMTPGRHYAWQLPKPGKPADWFSNYIINAKEGLDHSAKHSISFNDPNGNLMHRLFAMLYNKCPKGSLKQTAAGKGKRLAANQQQPNQKPLRKRMIP